MANEKTGLTMAAKRQEMIERALADSAMGMGTLYDTELLAGVFHGGKYYFVLQGQTQLFVAAYKPAVAPNQTQREGDFIRDSGRSGVFEDGEHVYVPQRQEVILLTTQEGMPAAVAIALMTREKSDG